MLCDSRDWFSFLCNELFYAVDDLESVTSEKDTVLAAAPRQLERYSKVQSDQESGEPVCYTYTSKAFPPCVISCH